MDAEKKVLTALTERFAECAADVTGKYMESMARLCMIFISSDPRSPGVVEPKVAALKIVIEETFKVVDENQIFKEVTRRMYAKAYKKEK